MGQEALPSTPPPVVAVLVTHGASPERLDVVLAALAAQDHPNLDVLVVDTGDDDPTERVAAVLPGAMVVRVGDVGFGAAANHVLDLVSGATFFAFCHDDARPDPGAVSALVAAAERWDADVVGPKLVTWDDDRRLAQLGLTVDRVGAPLPYVERGELDQGQHDGLRDVFAVPGAFTLVRAARFAEIGGFDEAITFVGDDVSLAWRARLAGARVLVTSAARVRHAEAFATRPAGPRPGRLAARHRLRVVLSSYRATSLLTAVPLALCYSLVAALAALVTGRPGQAADELAAWPWNVRRLGSLVTARRAVARFRRVPDRDVRRYQVRGLVGPRVQRRRVEAAGRDGSGRPGRRGRDVVAVPVRGHMDVDPTAWSPATVAVVVAVTAVVAFGSRHLLTRGVPVVGEMVPFGAGPGALIRQWASGWRPAGLGGVGAPPTLVGVAGVLGGALGGHTGLARTVLTVGLLAVGLVGAHRLAAPLGAKRAQVAAVVAYAAVPLPYDALAAGRWSALGAYAAAPWMLARLARASAVAPFAPGPLDDPAGAAVVRHSLVEHVMATGAVTALAGVLVPQAPLLLVVMGAALAVGGLLALEWRGAGRLVGAAAGGAVMAALLHLPTSLDLLRSAPARRAWLGAPDVPGRLRALDVVGLSTGATARGALALGLLGAAAVPLIVGRWWRFAWAARAWTLAGVCGGLVWARETGAVTVRLPDPGVVLAPAAAGLALAVALGVAAIDRDVALRSWRFGFRWLVVGLGVLALVASTASVVSVAVVDGRWGAPADDFARLLPFVQADLARSSGRVLWVGDRDQVPGRDGWPLGDDLVFTAAPSATPTVPDLWPRSAGDRGARLRAPLAAALGGQTTRLGARLAALGVRYVAVPRRLAPSDPAALSSAPDALLSALAGQLDLQRVQVDAGLVLYRNTAPGPAAPVRTGPGRDGYGWLVAVQLALWLAALATVVRMQWAAPAAPPPAPPDATRSDPPVADAPATGEEAEAPVLAGLAP